MVLVAASFEIAEVNQNFRARLYGSNGAEIVSEEMFAALIDKYINSPESYIRVDFLDQITISDVSDQVFFITSWVN